MKNLIPPVLDPKLVYETLLKNKSNDEYKQKMTECQTYVYSRYSEYEKNSRNLEFITKSTIVDKLSKDSLLSCYNRNKGGYLEGSVVKKIIDIQSEQHKNKCPYCLIEKPRTIDHYVPKDKYPEYAVYPANLIPCCSYCNSKKGETWLKDGKRIYINYYYDSLSNKKFLRANITFDKADIRNTTKVEFMLVNDDYIDKKTFEIIESHFKSLNLLEEYVESVTEQISNVYTKITDNLLDPIQDHIDNLVRDRNMFEKNYGINFWLTALYDAIIDSNIVQAIYAQCAATI